MTPTTHHKRLVEGDLGGIEALLQERLRLGINYIMIQVQEQEVEVFVNASPIEERRGNGSPEFSRDTLMGVIENLLMPRARI